ncbi:MAG: ABC transporter substrate-binding protein, partial [Candidatus Portnoybacteria bacterium]|nr:ABC transporter substrate-binding protein [Candidatus Portnoybacteria bacterium]
METGKTILWILIILIIVGGGYLFLRTPAAPLAPVAQEEKKMPSEPIKLGYIGPLTGELADGGEAGLAGATLAVKEINDAGGVLGRQLELVAEDDKCSAEGVNAMNKLVNIDKVVAITGPDCSASGGPALPIAQKAGVPVVVRWASAPHLTKIGDYIFRVYPSDAFQGKFIAEFLYNDLGKKKAAVVYVKNDWGQGIHDVFT